MKKPTRRQRPPRILTANDYARMAKADFLRGDFTAEELQDKTIRLLARVLAAHDLLRERGALSVLDATMEDYIIGILSRTIPPKHSGHRSLSDR